MTLVFASGLELGAAYNGTVTCIVYYGAFVDIGAEFDGLLHISMITTDRIKNVRDYLEVGQEATLDAVVVLVVMS